MIRHSNTPRLSRCLSRAALVSALCAFGLFPAIAQEAPKPAPAPESDVLKLDEFVVTGVSAPGLTTKMNSSVSVSTLPMESLQMTAPRATAELFRNLPSIRAESSSGDGNTNIAVRGLPITTGGAKYVQLQEDGLPVLLFGDIAFATADQFIRADATTGNMESIRGGSASTFTTNGPGGIINFISKTGDVAGGSIEVTRGLDYETNRLDLAYGGPLSSDMDFFVGGFYRNGEGAKTAGYDANNGGQFKANLTRKFANGSIRLFAKVLDDRTLSYMPVPMSISGSDSSPTYGSLPQFNALTGALNTPYLLSVLATRSPGSVSRHSVDSGVHSVSKAIGAEVHFTLPGGWNLADRVRYANNSGDFVDPYPATIDTAQALANGLGGAGATLRYANGPANGQALVPASVNGNGLLVRVHMFDTQLNDFSNLFNDAKLTRQFSLSDNARCDITAGFFTGRQQIDMDWTWNAYLLEVKGKKAALVDVYNAAGQRVTDSGLIAYGTTGYGGWGNTHQGYATTYTVAAPYADVQVKTGGFTIDGSVREDYGTARGNHFGGVNAAADVNGDGAITGPEQNVSFIDYAHPSPVNYDTNFTSYSTGVNYSATKDLSLFARYSRGGSENGQRAVGSPLLNAAGNAVSANATVAETKQAEMGAKYRTKHWVPGQLEFFGTVFMAKAAEVGNDPTRPARGLSPVFSNDYKSSGLEFEAAYGYGGFSLRANVTYQHSRIDTSSTAANVGHRPQRTPDAMFTVSPMYHVGHLTLGGALNGVSRSYAGDDNTLVQPGYMYVNLSAGYEIARGLTVSLSANNLFNTIGITEVDSGRINRPGGQAISARSITGRTVAVSLKYAF
jgi:outer membrane receptor protein involved in Fe transport